MKISDWSLRPNPDTYKDRAYETRKVLARIGKSTASVIGIAGVRGSGKSSLALKVLEENNKEGAFTLLVHSPTGYEAHEFLLSIFQRICERVISLIDIRFGEKESLESQGQKEWRRLRKVLYFLAAIPASIFIISFLYYVLVVDVRNRQQAYFQRRIHEAERAFHTAATQEGRASAKRTIDLLKAQRSLAEEEILDPISVDTLPLTVLLYASLIVAGYYYKKTRKRIVLYRKYPSETGLKKLALDLLEHLSYQRTLSASAEAGLGVGKASSKFTRGKTLQARPTSLPGLTSECSRFLDLAAGVFGGRAVVCLDELDKIKEPDELEKLLRGVKGILSSPRTHFLLTVSEDALARFSTRQRASRDILESTFEEIVVLDRVNLELAEHIVLTVSDYEAMPQPPIPTATSLFWVFGSGIPREIKRGVLLCRDVDLDPIHSKAIDIWRVLYNELIESISSWAALVGGEDRYTYYFLDALEKFRSAAPSETFELQKAANWVSELLKLSLRWTKLIDAVAEEERTHREKDRAEPQERRISIAGSFRRAVLEIVLAGSSCLWTLESGGASAKLSKQMEAELLSLFNYFSSNLEFAEAKAMTYIGFLEASGLIPSSWKDSGE